MEKRKKKLSGGKLAMHSSAKSNEAATSKPPANRPNHNIFIRVIIEKHIRVEYSIHDTLEVRI